MEEYMYRDSKLKIIGLVGLVSIVLLNPILLFGFGISGYEVGTILFPWAVLFGVLIMVGLMFNEM